MVIAVVNPVAMALLKPPGRWGGKGVDIAVGEGVADADAVTDGDIAEIHVFGGDYRAQVAPGLLETGDGACGFYDTGKHGLKLKTCLFLSRQ